MIDLQPTKQDETEAFRKANKIQRKNVQFTQDAPIEIHSTLAYSESEEGDPPPVPDKTIDKQDKIGSFFKKVDIYLRDYLIQ